MMIKMTDICNCCESIKLWIMLYLSMHKHITIISCLIHHMYNLRIYEIHINLKFFCYGDFIVFHNNHTPQSTTPSTEILSFSSKQLISLDVANFLRFKIAHFLSPCLHSSFLSNNNPPQTPILESISAYLSKKQQF